MQRVPVERSQPELGNPPAPERSEYADSGCFTCTGTAGEISEHHAPAKHGALTLCLRQYPHPRSHLAITSSHSRVSPASPDQHLQQTACGLHLRRIQIFRIYPGEYRPFPPCAVNPAPAAAERTSCTMEVSAANALAVSRTSSSSGTQVCPRLRPASAHKQCLRAKRLSQS